MDLPTSHSPVQPVPMWQQAQCVQAQPEALHAGPEGAPGLWPLVAFLTSVYPQDDGMRLRCQDFSAAADEQDSWLP